MKKIYFLILALFSLTLVGYAQPRPAETGGAAAAVNAAPAVVPAKYEGGLFGYNQKISGTLRFDDANDRLVFFNKENKETFAIPYEAVLVIYPQSRSVRSTAGTVVSHVPLPGAGLAGLIREKRRYLIVQFDDPDVDARGLANFKIENKALLDSVIKTLGDKAKLTQRGDAYYRPRTVKDPI